MNHTTQDIPYGYCHCGCGQKTNIALKNHTKKGYIKGQPHRFIQGHGTGPDLLPLAERFWAHVQKSDGCWLWTGRNSHGYGVIQIGGRNSAKESTHRLSWIMHNGPIPDGMFVCHRCDVRACVNPDHLFLGTNNDNMQDKVQKGRQPRGEQTGQAKLTEAQVLEIRALAAQGMTQAEIGRRFGTASSNVNLIVQRKIWKHI